MTPWNDIMRNIDFWKTIEGFHYMDCVVYTPDGLIHRHMVTPPPFNGRLSLTECDTSGNGSTSSQATSSQPPSDQSTRTSTSSPPRGSTSVRKASASTATRTATCTWRLATRPVVCTAWGSIQALSRPCTSSSRPRGNCAPCSSRLIRTWWRAANALCTACGWAMARQARPLHVPCWRSLTAFR